MASLGSFLLLSTFVVCAYAAVISVVGARRRSRRLIESGIGAFYLVCALLLDGVLLAGVLQVARAAEWTKAAWSLYKFSLLYLALLFAAMAVDRGFTW